MIKREQAIKQALASIGFEGLNVSVSCIKKVSDKETKNQKKLVIRRITNGCRL